MKLSGVFLLTTALVSLGAVPARADATAFIGSVTTPSNRQVKGFAAGMSMLVIGFEFEYASVKEDLIEASPSLRTGMGNILLQTPGVIAGVRPYVTTGLGMYSETLGTALHEKSLALNTGGGVKVSLLGPLQARIDYRVFKLRGTPLYSVVHRFYVGANLEF